MGKSREILFFLKVCSVEQRAKSQEPRAKSFPTLKIESSLSPGNPVLALHQATRIMLGRYVLQAHIAREAAEQRNPFSNKNRHSSNDEMLDEAGAQETLNRDASVDIDVVGATGSEFRNDFMRRARHLLDHAFTHRREVERRTAQNHDTLFSIGPRWKGENCFERFAADHQGIDGFYKLVVAVGFAATRRQKIEGAIRPRDKTIDTRSNKD